MGCGAYAKPAPEDPPPENWDERMRHYWATGRSGQTDDGGVSTVVEPGRCEWAVRYQHARMKAKAALCCGCVVFDPDKKRRDGGHCCNPDTYKRIENWTGALEPHPRTPKGSELRGSVGDIEQVEPEDPDAPSLKDVTVGRLKEHQRLLRKEQRAAEKAERAAGGDAGAAAPGGDTAAPGGGGAAPGGGGAEVIKVESAGADEAVSPATDWTEPPGEGPCSPDLRISPKAPLGLPAQPAS